MSTARQNFANTMHPEFVEPEERNGFGLPPRRPKGYMFDEPSIMIYINGIYHPEAEVAMAKASLAKLFRNGRSQAVRLPREFRFKGNQVRIRRVAEGVLLEPLISNARKWFIELDRLNVEPFFKKGRKQPLPPRREIFN